MRIVTALKVEGVVFFDHFSRLITGHSCILRALVTIYRAEMAISS